jgi:hypothetical protein
MCLSGEHQVLWYLILFLSDLYGSLSLCRGYQTLVFNTNFVSSCRRFDPGGSLDRRVNCRRVSQPRWVGARRSTKGGENGKGETRGLRVALCPGRVRLQ